MDSLTCLNNKAVCHGAGMRIIKKYTVKTCLKRPIKVALRAGINADSGFGVLSINEKCNPGNKEIWSIKKLTKQVTTNGVRIGKREEACKPEICACELENTA